MKPAAFDYIRADTGEEAVAALNDYGEDARILAGGQSLVAMLNMRLAKPSVIVDIMKADLGAPDIQDDRLVVPATTTQADLIARRDLLESVPLLAEALPWVGHPQTRARGTICGSLAHADPSAELPLILTILGGALRLRGPNGVREVPAEAFFQAMMLTDCAPDEMIEAALFPLSPNGAFAEVGRRTGDFAIVACAALHEDDETMLAIGGVNDTPIRRTWNGLDDGQMDDALNELAWSLDARSDLHATARYRRDLVRRLGRQTIEKAMQCAA
ncbi:MAG: FAD binding domain-containing protein [Pseudomonadota bacterium]